MTSVEDSVASTEDGVASTDEVIGRRRFVERLAAGAMLRVYARNRRLEGAFGRLASFALARSSASPTQGRPYHLVVLGDSIPWGQGLRDADKFSTLVQQWLAQRLNGRHVVKWTFAHSGAVIGPDSHDASPALPGEVPIRYPSVIAQLPIATHYLANHPLTDADHAAPVDPASVALVLVDGGINDVDVHPTGPSKGLLGRQYGSSPPLFSDQPNSITASLRRLRI